MRILAIRGRNLASLAGDFAVELDRPPLAQAGLFAITGPTGAGKSTLLDALCLALYDAMPRLAGAPKVAVAAGEADEDEGRLNADDVRGILRRGSAEAYAEVEFIGHDRRRYCARWEVRRARGRAGGRAQNQTMTLTDLATQQRLGGTRTETLAVIRERLGLSFEQFRRSVLLAQGDFASFLRAGARDRAELLERITGTQLYGELSKAAHQRARDEEEALRALEQALAAVAALPGEARAALDAEHAAQAATIADLEARHEGLRRLADWHARAATLAGDAEAAGRTLAQAQQAVDAAAARRQAWQDVCAAQPLRPVIAAADRARAEAAAADGRLDVAHTAHAEAEAGSAQAQAAAQTARAAYEAALAEREAGAPRLAQARVLDARLADAEARRSDCARQAALTAQDAARAGQALAALTQRAAQAEADRRRAADWLDAHAGFEALAAQWPRWDEAFAQLLTRNAEILTARTAQAGAGAALRTATAALTAADAARARTLAARRDADAELGRLATAVAAADAAGLAARRQALTRRLAAVQPLPALVARAHALETQAQAGAERIAHWQARQTALAATLADHAATLPQLRARADEAALAADRAALATADSVEALRAQLVDGEACPVCGATAHPWAHAAPALDALAAEARAHADALRHACESAVAAASAAQTQAIEARTRFAEAQAEAGKLAAERADLHARWAMRPVVEALADDPLAPALADVLDARLAQLACELAAIEAGDVEARRLAGAWQAAQQAAMAAAQAQETAAEAYRQQQTAVGACEQALAGAGADGERAAAAADALRATIAPACAALPGAGARLAADPVALHAEARQAVADWQAASGQRAMAVAALAQLAPQQAAAHAEAQAAQTAAVQAAQAADYAHAAHATLHAERAALFDGRPTAGVEAAFTAAVDRAGQGLTVAVAAETQAVRARDLAAGQAAAAEEARIRATADAVTATEALAVTLAAAGLEAAEARHRLAYDDAWLTAERRALDALADVVREAQVRLDERRTQAATHAATRPADPPAGADGALTAADPAVPAAALSPNAVAARLAATADVLAAARGVQAELAARLRADDRCRQDGAHRQAELAARRVQAEPWRALKELIGSADGSKFRGFAQSLTLEALVAHANRHLEELARRYRLRRVPGTELELMVVDRDMADEVRGVHSLSGGETFLVSLALALGLASLSSNRVQVETLLIDEGFGTLDSDTLDTAIAALDALQGLGRQVGVISHVPALVERIGVQVRVRALGGGRSRVET